MTERLVHPLGFWWIEFLFILKGELKLRNINIFLHSGLNPALNHLTDPDKRRYTIILAPICGEGVGKRCGCVW